MCRLETKYVLPVESLGEIEGRLTLLRCGLRRSYPSRYVNSLYFDSPVGLRLTDNLDGVGRRNKIRVRWYGEFWGLLAEPRLEVKLKSGHVGTKKRCSLEPFELCRTTSRASVREIFESSPIELSPCKAVDVVLATRYRRQYFESRDHVLRITLDDDIGYLPPPSCNGFSGFWRRDSRLVIELKYSVQDRSAAEGVAQDLGLRWSRNSKFVRGMKHIL